MFQRLLDRNSTAGRHRSGSGRRDTHPVLALQRLIGNHRTTQVIARDRKRGGGNKKQATLPHQVRVGDLEPIAIEPGAVADWIAKKKNAGDPVVSSKTGDHSEKLKALAAEKKGKKIDKIEFQEIVGENTWIIVRFRNARIRGYSVDGETERWTVTDYDEVNKEQTSIGKAR